MSRHRSSSPQLETALENFRQYPQRIDYQKAVGIALEKKPAETRLAEYLKLQETVGKECNWLNHEVGYELTCNGKHDEALAYWKGRFLEHPGFTSIHKGLEFALKKFPPARFLEEIQDLKKSVKVDHGAEWLRKQYVEIQSNMGNYEESLKMLYEEWKSDQSYYTETELTKGLEDAVEQQPTLVMDYLKRLERHGHFNLDIFMRIQAIPEYKGDDTSYLERYIEHTRDHRDFKRYYAYIYLAHIHGNYEHKHSTDQKHSADHKHKVDYIQRTILESDKLNDMYAMVVLRKLQEYKFPEGAEELCLRRIKKESSDSYFSISSSSFVEEFIKLKNPRDKLEEANLLYDSNPDVLEFAKNLLDATELCRTSAIAAETCEKILLKSKNSTRIRSLATDSLAEKLEMVDTKSAIKIWRRLILAYPKDTSFRDHLTELLNSRGNIDQAITIWGKLTKALKDEDCNKRHQQAEKQKEHLTKEKNDRAKQKESQEKLKSMARNGTQNVQFYWLIVDMSAVVNALRN
ncbi:hypothetical protein ACMFMG_006114 [Clarireedia jacksonii]